jgi:LmbE family N-acetylglucosaminyl deacetylase
MKNILAIGAHFDDVELAVGGTLCNLAKKKKNIFKLTLTDNVTKSKNLKLNIDYLTSKKSSVKACKILGIKEIENLMIRNCTELKYEVKLMQYIEDIIFEKKIDTVFMHYDNDLNQDHIVSYEICKTASRHCKNVLMYQSNFYISSKIFSPNFFVDISDTVDLKKKSLNSYSSQHNRKNKLFDTTILRNKVWGTSIGVDYAEAFLPVKFLYE